MTFSVMADVPNPLFDSNGNPFSGAVLKAFLPGSTTSTSIAIDSAGSSPQATITYNAAGKLEVTGNEILPYIDIKHKWGIFANATDAVANTPFYMGPFDNVTPPGVEAADIIAADTTRVFGAVALMVADTDLVLGQIAGFEGYFSAGDGGNNVGEVVTAATGTDDGGSFIDLPNTTPALQWRASFPGGKHNPKQWGAVGDGVADDSAAVLAALNFTSRIYFLQGNYNLASWTTPTLSAVDIDGDGAKLVTITGTAGNEFIIVDGSLSVQNIKIDTWETGFNCYDGTPPGNDITNIWIDNIESDNVAITLLNLFNGTTVTPVENLNITNSLFKNFERAIRYAKASSSALISGCTFDGGVASSSSDIRAISLSGGDNDTVENISIIGNTIKNIDQTFAGNQTFGIQAQGEQVTIIGNNVRDVIDSSGGATDVVGIFAKGSKVIVSNNTLVGVQDKGIECKGEDGTRVGRPGLIIDNILVQSSPLSGTGQAIVFKNSDWTIAGNYVDKYNIGVKANPDAEIYTIENNDIRVSGTSNVGIRLSHPWTDVRITSNRLSGSTPRIDIGTFAVGASLIQYDNGGDTVTGDLSEFIVPSTYTDSELDNITDRVNTLGKFTRLMVWNSTQDIPVWANGTADSDVWKDATGATVNTPI